MFPDSRRRYELQAARDVRQSVFEDCGVKAEEAPLSSLGPTFPLTADMSQRYQYPAGDCAVDNAVVVFSAEDVS